MSVNAGSINLYLGADTSAFQAGMKSVTSDLNTIGGTYDQFSARGARSVLAIGTSMTELTRVSSMSGASIAANLDMLAFHFGHMADQMQGTAGSGKVAMEALGKAAMSASLVVGAAFAGWQAGKAISEITGLTKAMRDAASPSEEYARSLANVVTIQEKLVIGAGLIANLFGVPLPIALETSTDRFDEAKAATLRLADSVGILVPEVVKNAEATKTGADAVVAFRDKIFAADKAITEYMGPVKAVADELAKAAKAHADLTQSFNAASIEAGAETVVWKDRNKVMESAYGIITQHLATEREWTSLLKGEKLSHEEAAAAAVVHADEQQKYIDKLIETNNLMKDPDPATSLAARTEEMRLLGGAGADAGKLLKSDLAAGFVAAEEAALNSGKKMSDSTIQLANAIKDNDVFAVQQWINKFGEVPKSVDEAVKEATPHLDAFQTNLAQGVALPFKEALKEFNALAVAVGNTKLKLNFDADIPGLRAQIQQAIADFLAQNPGSVPATGGINR